ncbi:hypothetical protein [Methylophaga thalassica]|uniref:hypothetical protein n=1 Tax=Methylophaga aminisulfidivorans TaxID=230105 RepID=UPI003A91D444
MDGKDVIYALREYLDHFKSQNIHTLPISSFEHQVSLAEKFATQCNEDKRMKHEESLELLKSVISSGANAIKAAILINGGGAVALLAFAGNAKDNPILVNIDSISLALFVFCLGVFLASLSSGITYFTQYLFHHFSHKPFGKITNYISSLFNFTSFLCFIFGVYFAAKSLGLDLGQFIV